MHIVAKRCIFLLKNYEPALLWNSFHITSTVTSDFVLTEKKKNHTKHSKDQNKLSMLKEHLFAVAAAAMAEAVSEAEV